MHLGFHRRSGVRRPTDWNRNLQLVVALCCLALPSAAGSLSDAEALGAFIESGRVENGFKTMGVLLCDADGVFYEKSFGGDDASSRHLLASATKLASATTVMTLVDDGLVALDDPIGKYLAKVQAFLITLADEVERLLD
jgi:CubicO group peptidase (beta-lactamase class C family)